MQDRLGSAEVAARSIGRRALRPPIHDEQEAINQLEAALTESVELQSLADVPVGAFLSGGVETRAERRYKQLKEKGMYAKMADVVEELRARDERDSKRPVAPLKHYPDAVFLDTTGLGIDEAVQAILGKWREKAVGTTQRG